MIDFRYHLVSLIAVFLALAVGVVLGAGPLDDPIGQTVESRADALSTSNNELREDKADLTDRIGDYEDFITRTTPALIGGRLEGSTVALVGLPGVTEGEAEAARTSLAAAGAAVPGSVLLTDDWASADRAAELDDALTRLMPPDVSFPEDTSSAARAALVLARGVVTADPAAAGAADDAAKTLLEGLREDGFLTLEDEPWKRGALVAVLAPLPEEPEPGEDTTSQRTALIAVPRMLATSGAVTVVAGATGSAEPGGLLADVRSDSEVAATVSTVDDVDTPAGRATLVLAFVAARADDPGHYGDGPGADEPLPDIEGVTTR
ncbi:copper transporter [Motilibacter aurantiacus]|uniref:copper transporter n=1 Tax=Motilibacter aurantiacus TaxID=2714955 RepID=UPI0014074C88|nr:copper transporter [Motilibacter aurantiacus]